MILIQPECFPCLLSQALRTAQAATDDEAIHKSVIKAALKRLESISSDVSAMEIVVEMQLMVKRITKCEDPYKETKMKSNELAISLYPKLKEMVASSSDRLLTAASIAAAGNALSFVTSLEGDLEKTVAETVKRKFALDDYDQFRNSVATSTQITYLADNAGEVVFDRVLIEELNRQVTYVVKSGPWGNDATMEDAIFAGLDSIARVITCGTPDPISILSPGSEQFLEAMHSADMVIAKGEALYDVLSEEERNIFYIFEVKCPVSARNLGAETNDIALIKR